MLISQRWLEEFVSIDSTPEQFSHLLNMTGIEVEGFVDKASTYKNFVIAKVIAKEKHPKADKLSVCTVFDGTSERTVVCGAPNVDAGQTIVLATEGAIVPNGGFEIAKRMLRGIESNGMICSKAELNLGTDHDGIWVLETDVALGTPLVDFLGANDIVYEISITPNRADALSHLGIAREYAALTGAQLRTPEPTVVESSTPCSAKVTIERPDLCDRYMARVVRGVSIKQSPDWMQRRLEAVGLRPKNIVVDATNYVMMECGQPLHAFDLSAIPNNHVLVGTVPTSTSFATLDDKQCTLHESMCVIKSEREAIAIGGVMGGLHSAVKDSTVDVLLECAHFNPSSVRRTARTLGISTDSSYRFERGTDIEITSYAINRVASLIQEYAGGVVEQGIIDEYPVQHIPAVVSIAFDRVRSLIGADLSNEHQLEILSALKFEIETKSENACTVRIPTYRVDVVTEIDVIEEIARVHHYDNIPSAESSMVPLTRNHIDKQFVAPTERTILRTFFANNGYNEILTQNQISIANAKVFIENPIELLNPLNEELDVMRPSMIPSFLKVISHNIRNGAKNLRLFEIGKVFLPSSKESTFLQGFEEQEILTCAVSGNAETKAWNSAERAFDFFDCKGIIESAVSFLGCTSCSFQTCIDSVPGFSQNVASILLNGKICGYVGEVNPQYAKSFDIEQPVYIAWVDFAELLQTRKQTKSYSKVSPFPTVKRDVAFVLDSSVPVGDVYSLIQKSTSDLVKEVRLFDVFSGTSLGDGKISYAFSLSLNALDRTLTDEEVEKEMKNVTSTVSSTFNASLRS